MTVIEQKRKFMELLMGGRPPGEALVEAGLPPDYGWHGILGEPWVLAKLRVQYQRGVTWTGLLNRTKERLEEVLEKPVGEGEVVQVRDVLAACKLVIETCKGNTPGLLQDRAAAEDSREVAAASVLGIVESKGVN